MDINRLRDNSAPMEERLDILLKSLTIEEKFKLFTGRMEAVERLGIKELSWRRSGARSAAAKRSGGRKYLPTGKDHGLSAAYWHEHELG